MFSTLTLPQFKADFIQGLKDMLTPDGLGAFILVLANSMQDQELHRALQSVLQESFLDLCQRDVSQAPEDDQVVFVALKESGIDALSQWQTFEKSPWELIYNPLRALRPARSAQQIIEQIRQPFDVNKFHFNKPFLKPEILWEGDYQGLAVRVLYNKFPFAPWHLLLVPEPEKQHPQYLTQTIHQSMMQLANQQAEIFTGFGLAFNSLGAYASINQLHFQGFIREQALPIENPVWHHNGGDQAYPLDCIRCSSSDEAWQYIEQFHENNRAYNLLYRANHCYLLPRQFQGKVDLADWAQGIAWHELCGVFTLSTREHIEKISAEHITQQLQSLKSDYI